MLRDIIVTTPKSEMANAAAEAAALAAEGYEGFYFRAFSHIPNVQRGSRVYYVEDGFVRGYALVSHVSAQDGTQCDTTNRLWKGVGTVFMSASTWTWIRPIPMKGFQGYRYADFPPVMIHAVGTCRDPKPKVG